MSAHNALRSTILVAAALALLLTTTPATAQDNEVQALQMDTSGSISGEIKPAPWSGYWWSRARGFMVKGWPNHSPAPFERYDQYVMSRIQKNPGSHAWESNIRNTHYNPKAEQWEGHCNGWSASSILAPEPRENVVRNSIEFTVGDQKALLAEQYMNTYCMFYGERNWGDGDEDDIYPDQFHKLLLEYLHGKKSAVVADTDCGKMVWNFPMYKFESSWSTGWFNDKRLKVRTTCYFTSDDVAPEYTGLKWFSKTYTYNLFIDDDGTVTGGEWTGSSKSDHPDFIWVPTGDAPNPQGTVQENPCLHPQFVKEITQGMPRDEGAETEPQAVLLEAGLQPTDLF